MMWKFDSEKDDDSIYIMAHLHKKPSGAGQVQTLTYLTRCAVYNRVCVCVCVCVRLPCGRAMLAVSFSPSVNETTVCITADCRHCEIIAPHFN